MCRVPTSGFELKSLGTERRARRSLGSRATPIWGLSHTHIADIHTSASAARARHWKLCTPGTLQKRTIDSVQGLEQVLMDFQKKWVGFTNFVFPPNMPPIFHDRHQIKNNGGGSVVKWRNLDPFGLKNVPDSQFLRSPREKYAARHACSRCRERVWVLCWDKVRLGRSGLGFRGLGPNLGLTLGPILAEPPNFGLTLTLITFGMTICNLDPTPKNRAHTQECPQTPHDVSCSKNPKKEHFRVLGF